MRLVNLKAITSTYTHTHSDDNIVSRRHGTTPMGGSHAMNRVNMEVIIPQKHLGFGVRDHLG